MGEHQYPALAYVFFAKQEKEPPAEVEKFFTYFVLDAVETIAVPGPKLRYIDDIFFFGHCFKPIQP